jgi:hypothetical protein
MARYVVSPRQSVRGPAVVDWKELLRGAAGVRVTNESPTILVVEAEPDAISRLRLQTDGSLIIEENRKLYPSGR